jgi:hypothetical protein
MKLTQAAASLGNRPKILRLAAEQHQIEVLHPLEDGAPWLFKRLALKAQVATVSTVPGTYIA